VQSKLYRTHDARRQIDAPEFSPASWIDQTSLPQTSRPSCWPTNHGASHDVADILTRRFAGSSISTIKMPVTPQSAAWLPP